ncbi:MAG: hypothetical protein EOO08_10965 [Chitinophagaceae bacterium]|nr:MAG: hypothetical protein EOO08_10965 [Chitinophagaceae bacterium]
MKKIIQIVSLLMLCTTTAQAQNALKLAASVAPAQQGKPIMVQLKVLDSVNIVSGHSLNIMRREGTGSWLKLNTAPITRMPLVAGADYTSKDKSFKRYVDFMLRKPSTPTQEKNTKGFAGIFLLNDNRFASYAGCYFEDKTAMPGGTYQYKLSDDGSGKDLSAAVTITVVAQPAKAVSGVSFEQRGQSVLLNWPSSEKYYAYRVYRSATPGGQPVQISKSPVAAAKMSGGNAPAYRFADTALAAGTTWYYQVSALDFLNNESALSDPLKVQVKDAALPKAVSNFRNEREKGTFRFTWTPVNDQNCAGYAIYRKSEREPAFKRVNTTLLPATAANFSDAPANDGTVYHYIIESVGKNGNTARSPVSLAVLPDRTPPAKPAHLAGSTRPALALLRWEANKETDLKGYWIYRASNRKKENLVLLNDSPVRGNSYTDSLPLVSSNEYVYCIQAIDNGYNRSPLSDTVIIQVPDVTAPRSVQGLAAETKGGKVLLQWRAVPDADVVGYTIFKSSDSAHRKFIAVNAMPVAALRFSDEPGAAIVRYYVTATDRSGNSSLPSAVLTVAIDPDTSGISAVRDLSIARNGQDSTVRLTWRNGAIGVKGYVVFRKSEGDEDFMPISPLLAEPGYNDRDARSGDRYSYYVRSYFADGIYRESAAAK